MNWLVLALLLAAALVFAAVFGFTGAWLLLRNVDRRLVTDLSAPLRAVVPQHKVPFAEPHDTDIALAVAAVADDRPTLHRLGRF